MNAAAVLVIEDERDILDVIDFNLRQAGFKVLRAGDGAEGLRLAMTQRPDIVLLDLMLPGIDGLEICRQLAADSATRRIPIIMLTAKSEEADMVAGLELGADDYITKPFSPRVLLARIKAVLRRRGRQADGSPEVVRVHDLVVDPLRHKVLVGERPVELTNTEFKVLYLLASRPGWVFTRYQIVDLVHGDDYAVTDRSVDVQIVGLRKKLGQAGKFIETVRGVGYRFRE